MSPNIHTPTTEQMRKNQVEIITDDIIMEAVENWDDSRIYERKIKDDVERLFTQSCHHLFTLWLSLHYITNWKCYKSSTRKLLY